MLGLLVEVVLDVLVGGGVPEAAVVIGGIGHADAPPGKEGILYWLVVMVWWIPQVGW